MPQPFARVVRVARTGSTNADLVAAVAADPGAWPHLSALVADAQDAGRGRAGRGWVTPPGTSLTVSVLLRPRVPAASLPWVALLGGLAVVRVCEDLGVRAALKWPNDVLALGAGAELVPGWGRDRKLAGLLAEALPGAGPTAAGGTAVVLGAGINVTQGAADLPVPWAGSLRTAGVAAGPADLLPALGKHLAALVGAWEDAGGGAEALAAEVRRSCTTLGRRVRAELPGGEVVTGLAAELDGDGRLVVATGGGGVRVVAAGDVLHVRPQDGG